MNMKDSRKTSDREREGHVVIRVIGGKSIARYSVRGDGVYEAVIGGSPRCIGFVKDGVAYTPIIGGKPRPLGRVVYKEKR